MNRHTKKYNAVALVLLGAGIYQVIAALLAGFFWLIHQDWTRLIPQIAFIAFWLAFPVTYLIWTKYRRHL